MDPGLRRNDDFKKKREGYHILLELLQSFYYDYMYRKYFLKLRLGKVMARTEEEKVADIAIGSFVKYLRELQCYSFRGLSQKCGVNFKTIDEIEKGQRTGMRNYIRLADGLGTTVAQFERVAREAERKFSEQPSSNQPAAVASTPIAFPQI